MLNFNQVSHVDAPPIQARLQQALKPYLGMDTFKIAMEMDFGEAVYYISPIEDCALEDTSIVRLFETLERHRLRLPGIVVDKESLCFVFENIDRVDELAAMIFKFAQHEKDLHRQAGFWTPAPR